MFIKKKETKTADDNDYDAIQNRDRHRRNKKNNKKQQHNQNNAVTTAKTLNDINNKRQLTAMTVTYLFLQ